MIALKVMIVDDEKHVRESLHQALTLEEFEIEAFDNARDALNNIEANWEGIVITDINMPDMSGVELLEQVQTIDSDIPVIVLTGHGNVSLAVEAMRLGAYDFLEKPFSVDVLIETVHRTLEKRTLTLENRNLRRELEVSELPGPRIIGRHPSIVRMRALLDKVKDTPADVLINGETGTGKELVARYIHQHSFRKQNPFVAINCGALPETIIESELFGHESGAFTGASKKRVGKFEYANGGTILLDEIESMPLNLQTKLLRVLEERKVEPLGANKQIPLDIRIIAATKEDLRVLADKGEFRSDLYYRLNVIQIDIPALRHRKSDIPMLFEHFMTIAAYRYGSEIPSLSEARTHALVSNDWPGNVRELRNVADCFTLLGESRAFGELTEGHDFSSGQLTLAEQMDHFEESVIRGALNTLNGVLKDVQASLGIGRKTLYEKMKKFNIDKTHFK